MPITLPYIPEYITVHLGAPSSNAKNVTVTFEDYIENVASSEIYPSWDEAAIRANVYAQISYALNRVYVEYYRSRGYNFDITNSTAMDQSFIHGRNIFKNIDEIVSEIFNVYIRKEGRVEPLAAKYCNGTTTTCNGMSQWGSQQLAKEGYIPFEILQHYYGKDVILESDAPMQSITESYPGKPLKLGSTGDYVTIIQVELNRISQDYPLINKINPADGNFGKETEAAVKTFQGIFNLVVDGIVGKATWYKLIMIYVGIKKLSELNSEGHKYFGTSFEIPQQEADSLRVGKMQMQEELEQGSTGEDVEIIQYFLSVIGTFYYEVPVVDITGVYGPETENSVRLFQQEFKLPETGKVDKDTLNEMYNVCRGIENAVFTNAEIFAIDAMPYQGEELKLGSKGDDVSTMQRYISTISNQYTEISPLVATGYYGSATENSVREYQKLFGLHITGKVNHTVWNAILNTYKDVIAASTSRPIQFPGNTMKLGDTDMKEA